MHRAEAQLTAGRQGKHAASRDTPRGGPQLPLGGSHGRNGGVRGISALEVDERQPDLQTQELGSHTDTSKAMTNAKRAERGDVGPPLKGEVPLLDSRKAVSELKASLESFKGDRFEWEEPTALRPVAATKSRYNANHEAPLFNGERSLGHRSCFQYHLIASNGRLFRFDLRSKMTWSKAREKEILEREEPGEYA